VVVCVAFEFLDSKPYKAYLDKIDKIPEAKKHLDGKSSLASQSAHGFDLYTRKLSHGSNRTRICAPTCLHVTVGRGEKYVFKPPFRALLEDVSCDAFEFATLTWTKQAHMGCNVTERSLRALATQPLSELVLSSLGGFPLVLADRS
jgi:hypothetical protein